MKILFIIARIAVNILVLLYGMSWYEKTRIPTNSDQNGMLNAAVRQAGRGGVPFLDSSSDDFPSLLYYYY